MTKNILIYLISALLFCPLFMSAENSPLIQQADSAYNAEDFRQAADLYLGAVNQEGPSAKLLYNLGNSYYRLGEMGNAILSYERALRLDPSDKDTRYNLEFVNTRITDRPGERGTFLGNALDSMSQVINSNTWAWIAFGCFVIMIAAILAYLFLDNVAVRKTGFFGGILAFLVCGVALFFSFRSASLALRDDVAIVTAPSTILSTVPRSPSDRTQEAMLLHEGTRVEILDSVRSTSAVDSVSAVWYDVQVDNSHRAWIKAADVEKI